MNWYQQFFQVGPIPENAMTGVYDFKLVILSYIIATMASYVALDMSAHLKKENTALFKFWWWIGGSFVMGAGIWSMHFIGMLAFSMEMPMTYSLFWTGLSMFIATVAAGIAFIFFTVKDPKPIHYILSGLILGSAILAMHYTGMAGMQDMFIHYKLDFFLWSVVIAVVAATAALWLASHSDKGPFARRVRWKIVSALIMGFAICGMHYMGMEAAVFTPDHDHNMMGMASAAIAPNLLAILITTIVVCVMSIALILSTTKYYVTTKVQNDKDFLEIVLNSLRGSVIAFDANKKLILYNQASKDLFKNIELIKDYSKDWSATFPLLKVDNHKIYEAADYPMEKIYDGQKVKNMEAIILDKDGTEHVMSIDGQLLIGQSDEKMGAVIVYQDITERKKIDQMKNEFISTVSHELRTPLTSIRGSLGLIMGGAMGEVPKEMMSLLEIACNNSERLVRLINDILDTEKIAAGKMVFHFAKSDLSDLVDQAVVANKPYSDKYKVAYKITEMVPNVRATIDVDRIRQVLDNLLSNAAKFSKPGDVIEVSLINKDGQVRVAISDKGAGIPEKFQARIFTKFYQADSSDVREKGGTGLGLSICKSIVEAHNGKIWFDSKPNVGTTFYFELPEDEVVTIEEIDAAQEVTQHQKILICEDDPDVSKLLGLILKQRGFNSVRVATIAEAKEALEKHSFCLMTLDLMLPDGNGLELLKWMRALPKLEKLPVVVISAISIEQEKIKGTALGIVDWINKPIDEERLYKDVAQALGTKNNHEKPRILHVEDEPDIAKIVSTVVKDICDTDVSATIATAKKMLRTIKYDLIILDLNLKDGTGYQLLTYLEESGFRIPVVILSVDEPLGNITENISASLVKSKVSNNDLLDKIVSIIEKNNPNTEMK